MEFLGKRNAACHTTDVHEWTDWLVGIMGAHTGARACPLETHQCAAVAMHCLACVFCVNFDIDGSQPTTVENVCDCVPMPQR